MPNPLMNIMASIPAGTSAGAPQADQPEGQEGSDFLEILNLFAPVDQATQDETEISASTAEEIEAENVEAELPDLDGEVPMVGAPLAIDAEPIRPTASAETQEPSAESGTKVPTHSAVAIEQVTSKTTELFENNPETEAIASGGRANDPQFRRINRSAELPVQNNSAPNVHRINTIEIAHKAAILRETGEIPKQDKFPTDIPEKLDQAPMNSNPQARAVNYVAPFSAPAVNTTPLIFTPTQDPTTELGESMFDSDLGTVSTVRDGPSSSVIRDSSTLAATVFTRPETARAVAGQIAAVVTTKPGSGNVEIALNPEELGRVSISMGGREDGFYLMISAERPETLDLMRRHIGVLSAEFQKLGLGDLSFDLSMAWGSHQDANDSPQQALFDDTDSEDLAEPAPRPTPAGLERGLDLRL
ncbi:flagellar hook-length control protein FliK [Ruegeria arenilitoris]|uniref:flagellar hook-length control protein FliK n=1 Tax=Ruegeria arenilitoris TaxID=1173585 RepID=UPI00147D0F69|nr:flagellar hook-length control protein FliK [Ruegeria arenilitoris]